MKSLPGRIIGSLLIIAAIGGLLFSILGLVGVWRFKEDAEAGLLTSLDLLSETLETTAVGLSVTQESLEGAIASLSALQGALETTAKTIQSTEPMVDSIAGIMEVDLPNAITATQGSLQSAQESARVIDGVLGTLSRIPFVGSSIKYNPETPLSEALGEVSLSFDDLPNTFADMQDSLDETQRNLEVLQVDFDLMTDAIRQIEESVTQYESVIDGYQESIEEVQVQLDLLSEKVPQAVEVTAWALTAFLAWMTIAQLGLFIQGWELVRGTDEGLL